MFRIARDVVPVRRVEFEGSFLDLLEQQQLRRQVQLMSMVNGCRRG